MYYQLLAHLVGDYVLQSEWMAINKARSTFAALVHVVCYTLPFVVLTQNPHALVLIAGTHFVIDRFGIARYICTARNFLCPIGMWPAVRAHSTSTPPWLETMLTIIVDNTMHLVINALVLAWAATH